jgi:hypothetical protein
MGQEKSRMTAKAGRAKISTTVAPETYDFFREQVSSGKARTIAEAVDRSVIELKRARNRARLEQATAAYFNGFTPEGMQEENRLASEMSQFGSNVSFDDEL